MMKQHAVEHPTSVGVDRRTGLMRRSRDLDEIAATMGGSDSVETALMCVKVAEAAGHVPAIVESLRRAGIMLDRDNRVRQAARYIERAISLIDRRKPSSELADLLLTLGRLRYRSSCDFRSCATLGREGLLVAEALGDPRLIARALCGTSDALTVIGDTPLSRRMLERALPLAEEHGGSAIQAHVYHASAAILMREHRFTEALDRYRASYDLARIAFGPEYQGVSLGGIAGALAMLGEHSGADYYFECARGMLEKADSTINRDLSIVSHAISYINRGESERALEMVRPVIARQRTHRGLQCQGYACYAAAMGTFALNDYRRAQTYADRSLRLAMEISDAYGVIRGHKLLASIAERGASSLWPIGREWRPSIEKRTIPDERAIDPATIEGVPRGEVSDAIEAEGEPIGRWSSKSELERRSQELLMSGAQLARKTETLLQLRHRIEPFLQREDDSGRLAAELLEVIEVTESGAEESGSLGRQFYDASSPFLKRLSMSCPELTATELKICTLLRSNLSSKEVATMLNLSVHTVDTHRQRIRRKLGLARTDSLSTRLLALG